MNCPTCRQKVSAHHMLLEQIKEIQIKHVKKPEMRAYLGKQEREELSNDLKPWFYANLEGVHTIYGCRIVPVDLHSYLKVEA